MGPPIRSVFGATFNVQRSLPGNEVMVVGGRWAAGSATATRTYTTASLGGGAATSGTTGSRKVVTTGGSDNFLLLHAIATTGAAICWFDTGTMSPPDGRFVGWFLVEILA